MEAPAHRGSDPRPPRPRSGAPPRASSCRCVTPRPLRAFGARAGFTQALVITTTPHPVISTERRFTPTLSFRPSEASGEISCRKRAHSPLTESRRLLARCARRDAPPPASGRWAGPHPPFHSSLRPHFAVDGGLRTSDPVFLPALRRDDRTVYPSSLQSEKRTQRPSLGATASAPPGSAEAGASRR